MTSIGYLAAAYWKLMNFTLKSSLLLKVRMKRWCSARHGLGCFGASSFIIMMLRFGEMAIRDNHHHPEITEIAGTNNGSMLLQKIYYPCRINGNIPGLRHGILPFMRLLFPPSTLILQRPNLTYCCRQITCIPTVNCRRM